MTVSKRDQANWKTIGQRERSQMRARKTQRRGEAAVTAGTSLGVGSMYMPGKMRATTGERVYPPRQAKMIWDVARMKEQKYGTAGVDGFSLPFSRMERAKNTLGAIKKLPAGAMFAGGAALAGAGGVGIAQGRAREAFHQRKINERRKARVKKDAPMDHESSGYARYGNFSTVGRKQADEFSKAMVRIPASQTSRGGKAGLKQLRGAAEEAAASQWKRQLAVSKSVVGHAEINFGRAARSAYSAMKSRKITPEQYKTAHRNASAAFYGQGKKIKPTSDVRMPSRAQVNWNPKPKKAPLYDSAPGLFNKADNRKVSNGQRVKTFNGRKATIVREDYTGGQRAARYIGQAINVANGNQTHIYPEAHRSAFAKPEKWWHRTGIRGTQTEDRKATELRLHQRSNGARNAQRGVQILGMGGIGAGGGAIIAGRKGGVIGGLAGGTLGAAIRPADRRLAFHRPVSKAFYEVDTKSGKHKEVSGNIKIGRKGDVLAHRRVIDRTGRNQQLGAIGLTGAGVGGAAATPMLRGKGRIAAGVGSAGALAGAVGLGQRSKSHQGKAVYNLRSDRLYVHGRERYKPEVSKRIRNKDAESDRQRRLGAGIALTGAGGLLLGGKGLAGAARATKAGRNVSISANKYRGLPDEAKSLFARGKIGTDDYKMGTGVMMSRRQLAEMGAGVGLLGASGATAGYARSQRNRRWE